MRERSALDKFCHTVVNRPMRNPDLEWMNYKDLYVYLPPYVDREQFYDHMLDSIRESTIEAVQTGKQELDAGVLCNFVLGHLLLSPIESYSGFHEHTWEMTQSIPIPEEVQNECRALAANAIN